MTINSYSEQQPVRVEGTFTDLNGTLTDPGTVTLTYRPPTGGTYSVSGTKSGTGVYYTDLAFGWGTAGLVRYYWAGTPTLIAFGDGAYYIDRSGVR